MSYVWKRQETPHNADFFFKSVKEIFIVSQTNVDDTQCLYEKQQRSLFDHQRQKITELLYQEAFT